MKNAEISMDLQGRSRRRFYVAGQKLLFNRAGDLTGSCFEDVSANFLYFNPCKKEVSCAWNYTMQTSESKEKNGLQKVRFLLQKTSCNFWFTLWYDPGNWAERGILMSQDAESPDRPLVVVFYGWLVPKLCENR